MRNLSVLKSLGNILVISWNMLIPWFECQCNKPWSMGLFRLFGPFWSSLPLISDSIWSVIPKCKLYFFANIDVLEWNKLAISQVIYLSHCFHVISLESFYSYNLSITTTNFVKMLFFLVSHWTSGNNAI